MAGGVKHLVFNCKDRKLFIKILPVQGSQSFLGDYKQKAFYSTNLPVLGMDALVTQTSVSRGMAESLLLDEG